MSKHFLNGTISGPYTDTGPGTIVVDPFADIQATGAFDALTLDTGPWKVTVNGSISAVDGAAIQLVGPELSNITIGLGASVFCSSNGIGIYANNAANITNAGTIGGIFGVQIGQGNYSINNLKTGVIEGYLLGLQAFGLGTHTITNAGTISAGHSAISGGEGAEVVTNYGSLNGNVTLGGGDDIFSNFAKVKVGTHKTVIKNGFVDGIVDLDAGNDHFFGGSTGEVVFDGDGQDIYKLGGGNDHFHGLLSGGNDLADVVDGGKGIDTYDASLSFGVFINLDTVDHFGFAAMTADDIEQDVASARETVKNVENAIGSDGDDVILGSSAANVLFGGAGVDSLTGFGGRDHLEGGAGNDFFIFTSLQDSGPTGGTRDTIVDFEGAGVAGGDKIALDIINTKLGDIINFLGTNVNFAGNAGDLRAVWVGDQTIVQLDKDGDKDADFSIALGGHLNPTSGDFIF
jgi:Ca2+-binding RTX toxin-like protein